MADDSISPAELTGELLHGLFDSAMFDVKMDADGDVIVSEKCRVIVSALRNGLIRFLAVLGVSEEASDEAGFALCNRINDGLIVIRAAMHDNSTMLVDWYLPAGGGISRRTIVAAFRQFTDLIGAIGQYDTDDILS